MISAAHCPLTAVRASPAVIAVSIVGAYALTEAIHHNVNGPAPDTMKQDWKNAERIKQEGRGQNPVYGYGTPK